MCMSRDWQGKNPLHLAAIEGHVDVLAELIRAAPLAAREKLDRGLTVLHLCVKHHQLEALKTLVPKLNEMLNSADDDGDTILHMAVRDKQIEIIQYLVESTDIHVNARNSKGQTAMAILEQSPPDTRNPEIRKILEPRIIYTSKNTNTKPVKWLTEKRDSIMVVAVLIATMAFQAGLSPAGGVWQEDLIQDSRGNLLDNPHRAGESVMAHHHPGAFKTFIHVNAIAFVSSLSTIMLLISGLPFRQKLFMWTLMITMWLTITSIAVTYGMSIAMVTPNNSKSLSPVLVTGIAVWSGGVMIILLAGNTVRLIDRWLKKKGVNVRRPKRFRNLAEVEHENAGQESVSLYDKHVVFVF